MQCSESRLIGLIYYQQVFRVWGWRLWCHLTDQIEGDWKCFSLTAPIPFYRSEYIFHKILRVEHMPLQHHDIKSELMCCCCCYSTPLMISTRSLNEERKKLAQKKSRLLKMFETWFGFFPTFVCVILRGTQKHIDSCVRSSVRKHNI